MSSRTAFLSRLIGLYLILTTLVMMMQKQATVEMMTALIHNQPLLYVVSVTALVAGLAIVLSHNVWSGGALPVVVTLAGWSILIKSLLLLFLPPDALAAFVAGVHYEQFFYLYSALSLVLGAYLTYGGFKSKNPKPYSQSFKSPN